MTCPPTLLGDYVFIEDIFSSLNKNFFLVSPTPDEFLNLNT